jgi:hypothetical protein
MTTEWGIPSRASARSAERNRERQKEAKMKTDLKPGDKLYFESRLRHFDAGKLHEVTITSIGHKWISFEGRFARADIDTMWADGGKYSSPGRYWRSHEEHAAEVEISALWMSLRKAMHDTMRRTTASANDIRQAADLLKLEL